MKLTIGVAVRVLAIVGFVWSYVACGAGTGGLQQTAEPNPLPSLVSLAPSSATAGGSDFTLAVTGSGFMASSVVRWNGSSRSTTFLDATRLNAAISAADVASAGTASVSISNPSPGGGVSSSVNFTIAERPTIGISPGAVTLDQGATQQFAATVTGMSDSSVNWSIQEGNSGGAITSTGLYQAPATAGMFHVAASSQADASVTAIVTVQVNEIQVTLNPQTAAVVLGKTRLFTATVQGTKLDQGVIWSVQEGTAGGTITNGGLYTAPVTLATYHVLATSAADPAKTASASVNVVEHGFSWTGNMFVPRKYHTATLLQNGDVLIAGGTSATGTQVLGSAEIYEHSTGTFRRVGSMFTQRAYHTATLLPNGKVLIAGGYADLYMGEILASAELYDPATETFSLAGEMTVVRASHTSTLLPDGKVLLAGGESNAPDNLSSWVADSAETYDPATGTFTYTGSMAESRFAHTATLLQDGRIFVAGGANDYALYSLSSTDVFDPTAISFNPTAPMGQSRAGHTATLLKDGRVFLVGGDQRDASDGLLFRINSNAEIFDPGSSTVSSLLPTDPRSIHTATLLPSGQVLLVGGYTALERTYEIYYRYTLPTPSAELFDPATQAFHFTGEMAVPRAGHTATLLQDGRVLVAGGSGDATAETYK